MSFEEFVAFYDKHERMPQQMNKPRKSLSIRQLEKGYQKYINALYKKEDRERRIFQKSIIKKTDTKDEKWVNIRNKVFTRDGNSCRLIEVLNPVEIEELHKRAGKYFLSILDPAHIFSRGAYSKLYYDPDNIVVLNRYSHSLLDNAKHPIFGNPISKDEREMWWIRILGKRHYENLKEKANAKRSIRNR